MKQINSHLSSLSRKKEQRRLRAAELFRQAVQQVEVGRRLKVTRAAVCQWYEVWQKEGKKGLISKGNPGPKPRLTEAKKKKIEQALLKGPKVFGYATNIWTLKRIAKVIHKVGKVSYHPGHVWKILIAMGWSSQKPETRVKQRDEKAIHYWKEVIWPSIKKRGKNYAQPLDF